MIAEKKSIGIYDFITRHEEYGSDLSVDVYKNGRYVETNRVNLINFDSQFQKIINRNLSH
jgi:hypothetical protein